MYSENQYSIDETYLVVLKYEIKEGDTNDEVSVFVNPAIGVTEPSPAAVYNQSSGSDVNTARGFAGAIWKQELSEFTYRSYSSCSKLWRVIWS